MKLEIQAKHLLPLKHLAEIKNELYFETKENFFEVLAFDGNALMGKFCLKKDKFIIYEKEEESIYVDLKDLKLLFTKMSKSPDTIITIFTKDNCIYFDFLERKYKLVLLEDIRSDKEKETKKHPTAKREKACYCIIAMDKMLDFLGDSFIDTDESVTFEMDKDMLYLAINTEIKELKDQMLVASGNFFPDNKCSYSKTLLKYMFNKLSTQIELEWEKKSYLRVTYLSDNFDLIYFLAPRVEND